MSTETDKIREMVMALARGDQEAAKEASTAVITAKTAKLSEEQLEETSYMMRAGHSHHNMAKRHRKHTQNRMRNRHATDEMDDMEYDSDMESHHDQLQNDDDYQLSLMNGDVRMMRMVLKDYGMDWSEEHARAMLDYGQKAARDLDLTFKGDMDTGVDMDMDYDKEGSY